LSFYIEGYIILVADTASLKSASCLKSFCWWFIFIIMLSFFHFHPPFHRHTYKGFQRIKWHSYLNISLCDLHFILWIQINCACMYIRFEAFTVTEWSEVYWGKLAVLVCSKFPTFLDFLCCHHQELIQCVMQLFVVYILDGSAQSPVFFSCWPTPGQEDQVLLATRMYGCVFV